MGTSISTDLTPAAAESSVPRLEKLTKAALPEPVNMAVRAMISMPNRVIKR
ncbi:hypothetical protein D3C85_1937230 [compost metagenome]